MTTPFTYDFGYSWPVAWGHAIPAVVFGLLLGLALWRHWPAWLTAIFGLVTAWAVTAVFAIQALLGINLPVRIPDPQFMAAGAGRVLDIGAGSGRATIGLLLARTETYDAVVLDLGLPRVDGLSLLRGWRDDGLSVPVLVLTARDAVPDRVRGLDAGADDYVVKPVDMDELAARLRALVRRAHGRPEECLEAHGVVLDPAARAVRKDGVEVTLAAREFDLLHALMLNAGRVLSREQLERHLYPWGREVESNAVEVHVHNLRRKLGADLIRTVRGVGYILPRAERAR